MQASHMASEMILFREGFVAQLTHRSLLAVDYDISRARRRVLPQWIVRVGDVVTKVVVMFVLNVCAQVAAAGEHRLALLTHEFLRDVG